MRMVLAVAGLILYMLSFAPLTAPLINGEFTHVLIGIAMNVTGAAAFWVNLASTKKLENESQRKNSG